jgi:hypothetical protein
MRLEINGDASSAATLAKTAAGCGYFRLPAPIQNDTCTTPEDEMATPVTPSGINALLRYLAKTRAKAETIRENAPAGSYLDGVLSRTIAGLDQEIAQLRYLLTVPDLQDRTAGHAHRRMRPAI